MVCASSINSRTGDGDCCTASMTFFSRCSNSPFTPAPACSRPRSRVRRVTVFRDSGTLPSAIRNARPSTSAVFPTPGSPTRIGLFLRRRERMSTIWRISVSRPNTGSIFPSFALAVTSRVNLSSAFCSAGLSSPSSISSPAGRPTNSTSPPWFCASSASRCISGRSSDCASSNGLRRSSWLCPSVNNGQRPSQRASFGFSTSAISRWTLRMCSSPLSEASSQACCIRVWMSSESWGRWRTERGCLSSQPSRSCQMPSISHS